MKSSDKILTHEDQGEILRKVIDGLRTCDDTFSGLNEQKPRDAVLYLLAIYGAARRDGNRALEILRRALPGCEGLVAELDAHLDATFIVVEVIREEREGEQGA